MKVQTLHFIIEVIKILLSLWISTSSYKRILIWIKIRILCL